MPLLNIKTNQAITDKNSFALEASQLAAKILGKPESYVMVQVEDEQCLIFAGEHDPCALLELKSLGLPEDTTADFSARLCEFMKVEAQIDASRIYIEFSSPERHMWGWDQRTF
mgnify:CR=1 FL=1